MNSAVRFKDLAIDLLMMWKLIFIMFQCCIKNPSNISSSNSQGNKENLEVW